MSAGYWARQYLPKHFTGQAWHRYPEFKRRSPKDRRPLHDTGQLQREVTASARRPSVRAAKRGPVVVRVPLKTSQTIKRPRGQPDCHTCCSCRLAHKCRSQFRNSSSGIALLCGPEPLRATLLEYPPDCFQIIGLYQDRRRLGDQWCRPTRQCREHQ